MRQYFFKVVSVLLVVSFVIGQISWGINEDTLSVAPASDKSADSYRHGDEVRGAMDLGAAEGSKPGAIGNGAALVALVKQGVIPERIDVLTINPATLAHLNEALVIAIGQAGMRKNTVPEQYRAMVNSALINLVTIDDAKNFYFFNSIVNGEEDFLLGFNYPNLPPAISIDFVERMIAQGYSDADIAELLFHECLPEDMIKSYVRDTRKSDDHPDLAELLQQHRTSYQEIAAPIFWKRIGEDKLGGFERVNILKKAARDFILFRLGITPEPPRPHDGLVPFTPPASKAQGVTDSSLVSYDQASRRIVAPIMDIVSRLKLDLSSVTVDQPQYWPNEKVNLKVLMPDRPGAEVEVTLTKKDSAPKPLGKMMLDATGILHYIMMDGETRRLPLGEYEVTVTPTGSDTKASAQFSVIEGALGASSFGVNWSPLKDSDVGNPPIGSWRFSRGGGQAGDRWGHGLFAKNRLLINSQPYNGVATVVARCYLPGCNGCEAAKPKRVNIKDGIFEVSLETGGHSGPFELELITDHGSVRHLFEGTGHVERRMAVLSGGLNKIYKAGLSPYGDTTQVPGRNIWIQSEAGNTDSAVSLMGAVSDNRGFGTLKMEKDVENLRIFVMTPDLGGKFSTKEVANLPSTSNKNDTIQVPIEGPYSIVVVAGFTNGQNVPFEGYGVIFTPCGVNISIEMDKIAAPQSIVNINLSTTDTVTGLPASVSGILEVYDTRVASRDPARPLTSNIGDAIRSAADMLRSFLSDRYHGRDKGLPIETLGASQVWTSGGVRSRGPIRTRGKVRTLGSSQFGGGSATTDELQQEDESGDEGELREGVQKVVFSGLVKTDQNGHARIPVRLGPQLGRYNVRFAAVKGLDYGSQQTQVDATKQAHVESSVMPVLVKGAVIEARVLVQNLTSGDLTLRVSGEMLKEDKIFNIPTGHKEITVRLRGGDDMGGALTLELSDASGNVVDKRRIPISGVNSQEVTFSSLKISDGTPIHILPGQSAVVYPDAGSLLQGIVRNMETTTHSWFHHGEAATAELAVKAIMVRAIENGIIDDEGREHMLIESIDNDMRRLRAEFFNQSDGLFVPYPGMDKTSTLWSAWMARNLISVVRALENTEVGADRLRQAVETAKELCTRVNAILEARGESIPELAGYDAKSENRDVVMITTREGATYQAITSPAVIDWISSEIAPALSGDDKALHGMVQRLYDIGRYKKAFEHVGSLPYLIQMAKALWIQGKGETAEFQVLFSRIARGAVLTKEPGLIQGPALMGGIYSNPQAMVRFLELLVMMQDGTPTVARSKPTNQAAGVAREVKITDDRGTSTIPLERAGLQVQVGKEERPKTVEAPRFAAVQISEDRTLRLQDYANTRPFARVNLGKSSLLVGEETSLSIGLDEGKDPVEYQAIIVVPSTVSVKQTGDILLDYKGAPIYGQRQVGGEKMQTLAVPFRGARTIELLLEGVQEGVSPGHVLVRHINNQDDISTIEIPQIQVGRVDTSDKPDQPFASQLAQEIIRDLPVKSQYFARNLMALLAQNDTERFMIAADTDIGGDGVGNETASIYDALRKLSELTDKEGKKMINNLVVVTGSGRSNLMDKIRGQAFDEGVKAENIILIGREACKQIYGNFEGRVWMSLIDDSKGASYLPILESATIGVMGRLGVDRANIMKLINSIQDNPLTPEAFDEMYRKKVFYILPRIGPIDSAELRRLYDRVTAVYLSA